MADFRPDLAAALDAFGVAAEVTLPGEEPVPTTVIWLPPVALQTLGVLSQTNRPLPVLALVKADVPSVPTGTQIDAPELEGGDIKSWVVEAVIGMTADEIRVVVIPAAEV